MTATQTKRCRQTAASALVSGQDTYAGRSSQERKTQANGHLRGGNCIHVRKVSATTNKWPWVALARVQVG